MTAEPIPQEALRAFARAAAARPARCPWNPFPVGSPWYQELDTIYSRDQSRRRGAYPWFRGLHLSRSDG